MTPAGARMVAERRTREHLARKSKEAAVNFEVVICLKLSLTLRVEAANQDEADDLANEQATERVLAMGAEELDRATHRVRALHEPIEARHRHQAIS